MGCAAAGLFFLFSNDADRKRALYKPYVVGTGALFLVGMAVTGFPLFMVLLVAPVIVVITKVNLAQMRFCDACGATAWQQWPFQPDRYCSNCGDELPRPPSG